MFEREGVAQTVNVVNGVFVRFVPPLVRHADAESEPDGVSRLLFGPLLSEYRVVERRGEFSLPVHVRKAAPPRDAVRALVAAVFGTRVAVVGNQRQRIARFFGHGRDHRGDRIVVAYDRQVGQSLSVHVGEVEYGLDVVALEKARNDAPAEPLFGKYGQRGRAYRIVPLARRVEHAFDAYVRRIIRVGTPCRAQAAQFVAGFEADGAPLFPAFFGVEAQRFARAVHRHGGDRPVEILGDVVEPRDVEVHGVATAVGDRFRFRRGLFAAEEYRIRSVGHSPAVAFAVGDP